MLIQSKRVWLADQFVPAQIEIEGSIIKAIYPYQTKVVDKDYGNSRIIPGMIDVHCHGAYGFDTNDGEGGGLEMWAKHLPEEGITGFLPTTVTQGVDVLTNALVGVAKYMRKEQKGAQVLGVNFEGPYLNTKFKGAQPEQFIVVPTIEQFKAYQDAAEGNIKIITLATEKDPDYALTRYASSNGTVVSIGHSGATYEEALMGVANGAMSMTHVFNGMTGFHHREPGLVGAAMRIKEVYGEIITDGNHVHWAAINNFVMDKGPNHAVMITDSLRCKGSPEGIYDLGGQSVEVRANGSAYLVGTNTLAGSSLKFNEGLRNLIEYVQVPVNYAINMVSLNAAKMLRIDDHKGKLVAGYDADIVVLDNEYNVEQTYSLGKAQL
ncbi:MAG: N-acetylglucosamine-6-phosphate deacetylase [Erysipelotrichaceae bacterium]|nr:N-acetylglucosamine-6-phosphate deacetylase [Erysipelotrichaceae bacterium]